MSRSDVSPEPERTGAGQTGPEQFAADRLAPDQIDAGRVAAGSTAGGWIDPAQIGADDAIALYESVRTRIVELVEPRDTDHLATVVPCTPAWTVQDVVAHVCGVAADIANDRTDGLGTDAWTAAQVDQRRAMSLGEIVDEWADHTRTLRDRFRVTPFLGVRLTGDAVLHLQDLQHALDAPVDRTDLATRLAAARYVAPLQERAADQVSVHLRVELDGGTAPVGRQAASARSAELVLRSTSFDFLRSVAGRRSRRQVESLDWSSDPTALLDRAWSAYGRLAADDVSI